MRRIIFTSLCIAALTLSIALAQSPKAHDPAATAQPAKQPAAAAAPAAPAAPGAPANNDEPIITRMRVQDYKAENYFYVETETTINQITAVVQEKLPQLMQTIKENNVEITGPMTFVYHGVTQDRDKPFKLQIGFLVGANAKEAGDFKARELEAFHCASVIYSGPIAQVGTAYQSLFTELFGAGLQPTGETREMYLYWEAPDSSNNVQIIMAGVN